MVCHDHIGLLFDDVFPADDGHLHGRHEAVETRPSPAGNPIGDVRTEQEKNADAQGNEKNGREDIKWHKYQPLVRLIEDMEECSFHQAAPVSGTSCLIALSICL